MWAGLISVTDHQEIEFESWLYLSRKSARCGSSQLAGECVIGSTKDQPLRTYDNYHLVLILFEERTRGEGGEFIQERKPADVLAAMEPFDPSMTSQIAEERGWPRWTASDVLNGLAEEEKIRTKKPKARQVI